MGGGVGGYRQYLCSECACVCSSSFSSSQIHSGNFCSSGNVPQLLFVVSTAIVTARN